jgi:fumarylacetoacetase
VAAQGAQSWLPVPPGSPFPLTNLPYGVGAPPGGEPRVVAALGDHAVDLAALARSGSLDGALPDPVATLGGHRLDPLMAAGPDAWGGLRARLQQLLSDQDAEVAVSPALLPREDLDQLLPFTVGDYVDFYSSRDHAERVGQLFRPDAEPLLANWRWLPVAYHGRGGTVVVSGTPIHRPVGQRQPSGDPRATPPPVGPTAELDVEVEVAFVAGVPSRLGDPVPTSAFRRHVFGVVLLNDWSARDIQSWEYRPLGPFLGKSFATTVSPWVVPLAALEHARTTPPRQDPEPPAYLHVDEEWALDVELELEINGAVVSRPPLKTMYWTMPQQLAHATVNGASVRTGDVFATGTVSGPGDAERGCLLEVGGPYLTDGDEVVIRGWAPGADGTRISFGDCAGTVLPARPA